MGSETRCDTAIVGAGIAGVAAARYLSAADPGRAITLLDRQQPLSLTTAKSGENFRAFWPQCCMADLAERSISLMEAEHSDSGQALGLKFSGYEFVSESTAPEIFGGAMAAARAGDSECVTDPVRLRRRWPHLARSVRQVLRIRRAGAVDVHALGSWLLRSARTGGVRMGTGEVRSIEHHPDGYRLELTGGRGERVLGASRLLLTAGPFNRRLCEQFGIDLPLENFLQHKLVVPDPLELVPRDMPFTVFTDPQRLAWSAEERGLISASPEFTWLLDEFPGGLHIKPEPGGRIKLGWACNRQSEPPAWEPPADERFPDIVMRGACRFMPALRAYVEEMPTPVMMYSGYYTRTPENWPLIGPLGPPGLFTVAGLSGFGTMVACAAGELIAAWMTGAPLPSYAPYFHPDRYDDPKIVAEMVANSSDGQL